MTNCHSEEIPSSERLALLERLSDAIVAFVMESFKTNYLSEAEAITVILHTFCQTRAIILLAGCGGNEEDAIDSARDERKGMDEFIAPLLEKCIKERSKLRKEKRGYVN